MPFYRPTLTDLRQQALQDIASSLPTGTPLRNSVLRILALTQAGMSHEHYGYIDWIAQQAVPFTATGEYLEAWARLKGVLRHPAVAAKGSATFSGLAGTIIPAGTSMTRADGVVYTVDASVTVGVLGTAIVAITASEEGANGNADAGTALTLTSPISGLISAGSASTDLTGGTDVELDDALRTRMNQKYAAPPLGGAVSDYITWVYQVPGVSRAWCRPNGAGYGTVVVYTMFDEAQAVNGGFPQGTNGVATLEKRDTAAAGDQLTVANAIYPVRPATALVYSAAPTGQAVNVSLANLLPSTPEIQTAIKAALAELYLSEGTPLGTTIYPSAISAAIESVSGISHFTLVSPIAPVTLPVGYIPTVGTLTVS